MEIVCKKCGADRDQLKQTNVFDNLYSGAMVVTYSCSVCEKKSEYVF